MLKPTTGVPLKRAKVRGSAIVSVTSPRSSSRTSPPVGRAIVVAASSARVLAPARVRIAWSRPPISARPPARSTLLPRSWRLTSSGVKPTACRADRIEPDPDFALDAADPLDARNAAQPLQRADHHVLDEPGQLLGRFSRRDRRIGENGQTDDVDALDQRLVDAARQIGAHARDGVLDVVERAIGVGFQPESDGRGRNPVGDRRN